jgi:hypothetical protein
MALPERDASILWVLLLLPLLLAGTAVHHGMHALSGFENWSKQSNAAAQRNSPKLNVKPIPVEI